MKNILFSLWVILILASCQKEQITLSADAHDTFFLEEKGNSMPIQVHGNVASNKLLLVVHGGPGDNAIDYRDEYVKSNVEKEFAMVYWDQRLSGSTQGNATEIDISLYKNDLKKVIQLLHFRYGSSKEIYLFGHSWGGLLAPYFIEQDNNQDMVKGWIQVDGVHNFTMNDSLTHNMLLNYAKNEILAGKNMVKWQEIQDYCNTHAFNESLDVSNQLNIYAWLGQTLIENIQAPASQSLYYRATANNASVISQTINGEISYRKRINKQAYNLSISENLYKIKLPTLLLWGRHDFICPIGLTDDIKKYIGSIDVTEKTFEKSGHSPMLNEPAAFWTEVITWVNAH
jgi:pimeloyl-ACP methyl ester carboxylesterase